MFRESGINHILSKAIKAEVSPNIPTVLKNLNAKGPLLQGSQPTSAELAGNSGGVTAFQAFAHSVNPEKVESRFLQNQNLRKQVLSGMATEQRLKEANSFRNSTANAMYEYARNQPFIPVDTEIRRILAAPEVKKSFDQLVVNSARIGKPVPKSIIESVLYTGKGNPTIDPQAIHYMKVALDRYKTKALDPATQLDQNAIQKEISRFEKWREVNHPTYHAAQKTYEALSKPVNALEDKLRLNKAMYPPNVAQGGAEETPANLAELLASKKTDEWGKTITDRLTGEEKGLYHRVLKDANRANRAFGGRQGSISENMPNGTYQGSSVGGGLAQAVTGIPAAYQLSRALTFSKYTGQTKKLQDAIVEASDNPKVFSKLLSQPDRVPLLKDLANNKKIIPASSLMSYLIGNSLNQ